MKTMLTESQAKVTISKRNYPKVENYTKIEIYQNILPQSISTFFAQFVPI